ncbi:C-GCAxxG-C-C family protein [Lacrimispora sp. NSJ-141]|uniref:C-GCAxxG-C-C family protein n=1 Tax=Lientehia hominis TaxID=2897778 RepID=A0AAP2RLT8_9FIRM|nr:C-GCAxxG-C-C family protein [Lientehia hominis]MCD2493553.1 C-GCAxxG-C-C family protein [Lientehia hominis]
MKTRVMQTKERHDKGFNCCQAVACTYCDLVGMDEETAFKACEAFGAGMGGMQGTCGAVSAAVFLAGLKNSCGDLKRPVSKGKTYKLSKEIAEEFRKKNGSIICKELKGVETKQILRSCEGCIMDAAEIIERLLFEEKN